MDARTLIAGLDPGLRTGGLVVVEKTTSERVLASISIVEPAGAVAQARKRADDLAARLGGWSDREFLAAALRADKWCERLVSALDEIEVEHGPIDIFAVESFIDQPSKAQRVQRKRWMTPLVMGQLAVVLRQRGSDVANGRVVYQNAGVVIRQWSAEIGLLAQRRRGATNSVVIAGDEQVGNDHERKALAHALALSLRLDANTKTPPNPATTSTV